MAAVRMKRRSRIKKKNHSDLVIVAMSGWGGQEEVVKDDLAVPSLNDQKDGSHHVQKSKKTDEDAGSLWDLLSLRCQEKVFVVLSKEDKEI